MDQEAKKTASNIQQSIWKLEQAIALLKTVDGFEDYIKNIELAVSDLNAELEEFVSVESK